MNKQELIDAVLKLTSTRNIKMAAEYERDIVNGDANTTLEDKYGHSGDCFDAGMDIGEAFAIQSVVQLLTAELR